MSEFIVTWEVSYSESEKVYLTDEYIESKDLNSLKEYLGENAMDHTPEMNVPYESGDFNIEWVKIQDAETDKELWRDTDFEEPIDNES
tara:strand:- start:30 stop:293 length:264 start_codon:yes stop_codon:yes gene_type:complete